MILSVSCLYLIMLFVLLNYCVLFYVVKVGINAIVVFFVFWTKWVNDWRHNKTFFMPLLPVYIMWQADNSGAGAWWSSKRVLVREQGCQMSFEFCVRKRALGVLWVTIVFSCCLPLVSFAFKLTLLILNIITFQILESWFVASIWFCSLRHIPIVRKKELYRCEAKFCLNMFC